MWPFPIVWYWLKSTCFWYQWLVFHFPLSVAGCLNDAAQIGCDINATHRSIEIKNKLPACAHVFLNSLLVKPLYLSLIQVRLSTGFL